MNTKGKRGGAVKKAPAGYYTAQDAQKKLGMNASTFGYYVRKGKIKRHVPPMRTEGFYEKREIDQLASEIAIFLHSNIEDNPTTKTRVAVADDTPGIVEVLTSMGWKTATAEQRADWYTVNPLIDYIVIKQEMVVGYIHAVAYKNNILEDMMSGKKRSWNIQKDDILRYEPGNTYDLYIGIATRQDIPNQKQYAFRLISGFISFMEELAQQRIFIHHLYGVSAEPDGQKLSKALGFAQQPAKKDDLFPRFQLDLRTSNSIFARRYREVVKSVEEGNA